MNQSSSADRDNGPLPMNPPTAYTVFLPPSHPFMKISDAEFADLWGMNIARKVVEPIPPSVDVTSEQKEPG